MGAGGTIGKEVRMRRKIKRGRSGGGVTKKKKRETNGDWEIAVEDNN